MFGGLGLKVQPDGSSVGIIFEDSFNEEGTGAGKAIFEIGCKFSALESMKKFNSTASEERGAVGEQSGSNWGVSY